MEPLYAPWRIAYIRGPKPAPGTAHLFKEIADSSDDVGNYVVARDKTCYAVLNRYPYTGGHVLVVPYKLSPDLNGLTEEELGDLFILTRRCQNALTQVMRPEGFNIGINLGRVAGAGIIDHVHVHIVPRWNGDTNFMPVIGSTTVVPEALTEIAAQLRVALAK
ncbi:MAG TPA: HIT domain-containing protein [Verrucomicrobiae bacterium]|jgi:ATP adenylyltransferase|nr:HIT domain-containing protein [Verrucomicrobiae bacterium]